MTVSETIVRQPFELEVRDLAVERDAGAVFESLSFSVRNAQVAHVTGANGSGKTTLLKTLCALVRPESGAIRCNGRPIRENLLEYLGGISFVGHESAIKLDLTALENLEFERRFRTGRQDVSSLDALDALGAGHCADVPCRYLSAGARRRVALARLLVHDAQMWLLDEPLAALDGPAQRKFLELLGKHLATGGSAVVTSHQPLEFADSDVIAIGLDRRVDS